MNAPKSTLTPPVSIRLEASTVCQLKCPVCQQRNGKIKKYLGWGFLSLQNFKKIVDENPSIRFIELSNWGEIFLNPQLIDIIKYGYEKNVVLTATNGANLNTMPEAMPEALVKYQFNRITCSIDGASQETYRIYRKNGNFRKVLEHIKKINYFKLKYHSLFPILTWQFIPFSHNEHEILKAQKIAKTLNMVFKIKPPHNQRLSGENTKNLVKKICHLGADSEKNNKDKFDILTSRMMCKLLWVQPQINYDGRLLGCCHLYKESFGNVFKEGLISALNNKKMTLARQLLSGKGPTGADTPCARCHYYEVIKKHKAWFKNSELNFLPGTTREKIGLRRKLVKTLKSRLPHN